MHLRKLWNRFWYPHAEWNNKNYTHYKFIHSLPVQNVAKLNRKLKDSLLGYGCSQESIQDFIFYVSMSCNYRPFEEYIYTLVEFCENKKVCRNSALMEEADKLLGLRAYLNPSVNPLWGYTGQESKEVRDFVVKSVKQFKEKYCKYYFPFVIVDPEAKKFFEEEIDFVFNRSNTVDVFSENMPLEEDLITVCTKIREYAIEDKFVQSLEKYFPGVIQILQLKSYKDKYRKACQAYKDRIQSNPKQSELTKELYDLLLKTFQDGETKLDGIKIVDDVLFVSDQPIKIIVNKEGNVRYAFCGKYYGLDDDELKIDILYVLGTDYID